MKNYVVFDQITTFETLIFALHTERIIYVRSWHQVRACSFFHFRASFPPEKLQKMVAAGDFWHVKPKKEIQAERITNTVEEIKRAMDELSSESNATISDVRRVVGEWFK